MKPDYFAKKFQIKFLTANFIVFIFTIFFFAFLGVSGVFAQEECKSYPGCNSEGTCKVGFYDYDNPPGESEVVNSGLDYCKYRIENNGIPTRGETSRTCGSATTKQYFPISILDGDCPNPGTCTIFGWATDKAGNVGEEKSIELNICAGCVIGGVPYDDGDCNPDNECEWCDSSKSTTAWSPIPAGGYICTASGKTPVSSTNYCETPYDSCDNSSTCTGSRLYRGCTGTGFCSILEENGYKINYPAVCEGLTCLAPYCDDPSNCNGHYKTCNAAGSCANVLNDDSACTADIECGAYCQNSSTCTGYSKRCTGAVNQGSCTTTGQVSDPTPCDGLDCGTCCICAAGRSYDSLQDEDCLASGYQCSNPLTCSGHYHQGICTALDSCGLDPVETPDPSQCDGLDCGTCCTCAVGRLYDSTQDADCSVGGYTCTNPLTCSGHYHQGICTALDSCGLDPTEIPDSSQCDGLDCGTCCICVSGRSYDSTQDIDCPAGGGECTDPLTCSGYAYQGVCQALDSCGLDPVETPDSSQCDGLDCGICCLCASGRSYDSLQDEDCLAGGYECTNPLTCSGHYHQGICQALDSCGLDPTEISDPLQCDGLDCGTCCLCAAGRSYDSTQDIDCSAGSGDCTDPLTCSGHYHQGICQALDSCTLDPTEISDPSQCDGLDCGTCCICAAGRSYDSLQDEDCLAGGYQCTNPLTCSGHYHQGICQALDSCGYGPAETPDPSQCDGLDCGTCCICSNGKSPDYTQDEDCPAGGGECSNPLTCSGNYHQGICDEAIDYSCTLDPTEIPDPSQCDGLDCGTCCICASGRSYDFTQDIDCPAGGYTCSDPLTCSGYYHRGICQALDSCTLDYPTEVPDPSQCDGLDCGICCLCANGRSYDSLQDEDCLAGGYECSNPLTCSGHYHQGICVALDACTLDSTEVPDPSQCDGLDCGEKSDTCDDYCSAKKLVEYNNNCIRDSTPISCDKTCDALGVCQDCDLPSCPPTVTHCCDGVYNVCGAGCDDDSDCPGESVCQDDCTCSGIRECGPETSICCDGFYWCASGEVFNGASCASVSSTNYCEMPAESCDDAPNCQGSKLYKGCSASHVCSDLPEDGHTEDYDTACDDESCEDGLWCTVDDICSSGECSGTERDCKDLNPCTFDSCIETDGMGFCEHIKITECYSGDGACVDGTWWDDHCSDGIQDCDEEGIDCGGVDCPPCGAPGISVTITTRVTVVAGWPPDKPISVGVSWDNCSVQALSIPALHWTYSDSDDVPAGTDPQTAYEIRIKDSSNFPDESTPDEWRGSGGTGTFYSPSYPSDDGYLWRSWMNWDTDYWWIVRVKDSNDNWSEEWSDPSQFRTPLHAGPWPEFTPSPSRVSLNQVVTFEDNSRCYTFPGNNEFKCQDLPLTSYEWDFDYIEPAFTVNDTTKGNATTFYGDFRNYKVKLRITDDIDVCYSKTETVTVTRPLPEWMEIPPF